MNPLPSPMIQPRRATAFNRSQSSRPPRPRHGWHWLLVACQITASVAWAADPIFPAEAKLEKIFEGITLTEGVAVAPDGQVYFSDITFSHKSRNDRGENIAHARLHIGANYPASAVVGPFANNHVTRRIELDAIRHPAG